MQVEPLNYYTKLINPMLPGLELRLTLAESAEGAQDLTRRGVIRPVEAARVQAQAEVAAIEFTEEIEIIAPVSQPVEPPPARRTRTKQPKR